MFSNEAYVRWPHFRNLFYRNSQSVNLFFSPHLTICLLIWERVREREKRRRRRRRRKKHQCERETVTGCLPYVPQPGIKPTTWVCALTEVQTGSNQLSHQARAVHLSLWQHNNHWQKIACINNSYSMVYYSTFIWRKVYIISGVKIWSQIQC